MENPVCEVCGGSGWKILEKDGLSAAERCTCFPLYPVVENPEAAANVPPLYQAASLENFVLPSENPIAARDLTRVLLTVRSYIKEFPCGPKPGLLLIGGTGTGKTHLAVAVLRMLMAKGFQGLFYDYANLLQRIRSSYDPMSGASDRSAYESALEADVLMLDDLGAHRVSDWVEDTVTSIVTYRCNNKKTLIATSNLPDPDAGDTIVQRTPGAGQVEYRTTLSERIGERARSRLFEMCEVVRMPAIGDYRLRRPR
jgi:DNA replication protein DnaC